MVFADSESAICCRALLYRHQWLDSRIHQYGDFLAINSLGLNFYQPVDLQLILSAIG
jgi:hypothetical protein